MSSIPFMTLTEFRASGRDVDADQLAEVAGLDDFEDGGRVYAQHFYIERSPKMAGTEWCLNISNQSWIGELAPLEAILYGYARTEGMADPPDQEAALIDEFQTFCRDAGLPQLSADELLLIARFAGKISAAQIAYIEDFISRWDRHGSEGPY